MNPPRIAWFFPGQGAQAVGMGRDVFDESRAAREVFERADEALGEPLSKLCFEGPEAELVLTANTQPAVVTASYALLSALRERYPDLPAPVVAAGHSLGEYTALVAAGALGFEDAVRLCRLRGRAMQGAVAPGAGAMLALLGLSADAAREVCAAASLPDGSQIVSPANFNAPGQTVVAGHAAAIKRADEIARERGGKTATLQVSAPFHCALMADAARALADALASVDIKALAFPVIANVDAEPNVDPARVKDLLVRQVASPVEWTRTVEKARALGAEKALEIGPGRVLAGLCKRIDKALKVHGVSDASGLEAAGEFFKGANSSV